MTSVQIAGVRPRRGRGGTPRGSTLGAVSGTGLGVAVLYLSLLVLLPLAAVVARGTGSGWHEFWHAVTTRQARYAIGLSVVVALAAAAVNAVMGTLIAWVLVRDRFPGKRLVETVIDIPFALPTIVAGLVLLSLYGPTSPLGLHWYATTQGIFVALLFVTLPFVVRTVQPVLLELDREVEEAAASLGASRLATFRRIVLPTLLPAILAGSGLAFARAIGEYGSVVLISGNLDYRTVVAPMYVFTQIQNDDLVGAAATSTVMLGIAVVVLAAIGLVQRRAAGRD